MSDHSTRSGFERSQIGGEGDHVVDREILDGRLHDHALAAVSRAVLEVVELAHKIAWRAASESRKADHRNAPVNALGYLRVMFTVDDIDETLVRLQKIGAQLVGEVVKYEELYRLCYIRGPEGLLIGLAQELS